jgi:ABC-type sugar transport system permease subunit
VRLATTTGRRRFRPPVGFVLVLPALIFLTAFMVYPVANLIFLSFHDYSPLRSADVTWVGIDNYATALTEPATFDSLWTTVIFTVGSVAIELVLGLLVATLLARVTLEYGGWAGRFLSRAFAAGFILPFAIPGVVAAVVWKMFLDPQIGPLDADRRPVAWFAHHPLTAIIIDAENVPFVMFCLRDHVDRAQQFEAARLDGEPLAGIRHLTLPGSSRAGGDGRIRAVDAFTRFRHHPRHDRQRAGPGDDGLSALHRRMFISLRSAKPGSPSSPSSFRHIGAALAMNRRAQS